MSDEHEVGSNRGITTTTDRRMLDPDVTVEISGETVTNARKGTKKQQRRYQVHISRLRERIAKVDEDMSFLDEYKGRSGLSLGDELRVNVLEQTDEEDIDRLMDHSDADLTPVLRGIHRYVEDNDIDFEE